MRRLPRRVVGRGLTFDGRLLFGRGGAVPGAIPIGGGHVPVGGDVAIAGVGIGDGGGPADARRRAGGRIAAVRRRDGAGRGDVAVAVQAPVGNVVRIAAPAVVEVVAVAVGRVSIGAGAVAELLPGNGGLGHHAGIGEREHRHALLHLRLCRGARLEGDRGCLGGQAV